MGGRDNYKEVKSNDRCAPETREEVSEDVPEECYHLGWVSRSQAKKESKTADRGRKRRLRSMNRHVGN